MAEKVTINDFVRWITQQIHPAELSALMSKYGYTDDSHESILSAIESSNDFRLEIGSLLRESIKRNKKERARVIGGVGFEDDSMTIDEWKQIIKSKRMLNRASGTNIDTASDSTSKKSFWDYFGLIVGTFGGVAQSIWGRPVEENENKNQQSGSNTFLYIIIVVVLIAVVGIVWVSTSKK